MITSKKSKKNNSRTTGSSSLSPLTCALVSVLIGTSAVASFSVKGGTALFGTRTSSRTSTTFYEGSVSREKEIVRTKNNRWFPALNSKQQQVHAVKDPASNTDEDAVDAYLEFLDRRYRRMHDDDEAPTDQANNNKKPGVVFSISKWLKQDPFADFVAQQQVQDDALYVLGVAGLASKKLLQKHQIPPEIVQPKNKSEDAVNKEAIDVDSAEAVESVVLPSKRATRFANGASRVVSKISNTRQRLHKLQDRQIKAAAFVVVKAPVTMAKKLWELGGGKHTVTCTLSVALALTLVLARPLGQFVANEGLNMTTGA